MKKPIFSFLASLCLFFPAIAQVKPSQHIKTIKSKAPAFISFTPITSPGANVPDITVKVDGYTKPQLQIAKTGDQLLILDFWATWCAPCRAILPHLDSLQQRFGEKVLILPVTYETKAVAAPVLAAINKIHPFQLPDVYNDKVLVNLFPHKYLPHEVWIRNGKVVAITSQDEITPVNIRQLLRGGTIITVKHDSTIAFDRHKPFLINNNGGDGAGMIYHEVLTGFVEGIGGGVEVTSADSAKGQRFSTYNTPLLNLYKLSFHDQLPFIPKARVRLMTRDTDQLDSHLHGAPYHQWLAAGHGWCYELQVPPTLMAAKGYALMRESLARLFPHFHAAIEQQTVRCLVLVRTSGEDKLKTAGDPHEVAITPFKTHLRNGHLYELFWRLEGQYLQGSPIPVVDGTGYDGKVDLDFDAPLNDIKAINAALSKYDLAFVEKEYPVKLLVIRDQPQTP